MVLSREILEEALEQAKKGRMQILESYDCNNSMNHVNICPNYAPKILTMTY